MKKTLPLLLMIICLHGNAHLQYIHLEKVNPSGQYNKEINFISDNLQYYDHWAPEWNYPIKKDSLIRELKRCYTLFEKTPADNAETDLLLGEIASYLYNMNVQDYFGKAESAYQKAIRLSEKDYRGYWFLASHYASSAVEDKAVIFFERAEKLLPSDAPADFWAEYGYAMLLANMISHCSMALHNAQKLHDGSEYVNQLDQILQTRWQSIDPDSSYKMEDIWELAGRDKLVTYVSRPLGIKIKVDSSWGVQFPPYDNHQTALILKPKRVTSKKGNKIGYSIAILFKVPAPEETLQAYVENITKGQGKLVPDTFSIPIKDAVSYSLLNKEMYSDIGGGHFHVVGIERTAPAFPGLLLEEPQNIPKEEGGEMKVYRAHAERKRMPGRIFYLLLLDTCEDIHEASFDSFRKLVRDQLIIE